MGTNGFLAKLQKKWNEDKFVCIGLDPQDSALKDICTFNQNIIDQTADLVCCYKPNSAFYEAEGLEGLEGLEKTVKYIKENHPDIPIILDSKRGDIGNTNKGYVKAAFDDLGVDALTVHPYLGKESLQPFLDRKDRGIIVLVKTSNPGAGEFQDLESNGKSLYQIVAEHVKSWNTNGNCGVVVGATYPEELKIVREIVGDMPILIPGVGAQGGDLDATVKAGKNSKGGGMIISSSRAIIFSDNPRQATLKLHQQIQEALK